MLSLIRPAARYVVSRTYIFAICFSIFQLALSFGGQVVCQWPVIAVRGWEGVTIKGWSIGMGDFQIEVATAPTWVEQAVK